jgi:hypothetical protein
VFIIGSSGRCGTVALTRAMSGGRSDHMVAHEPQPRLLREAWLKHVGQPWQTPDYVARMAWLAERQGTPYGETWRAPNLLSDVALHAPGCRFVVLVRPPDQYIRSAHFMRVMERGDEWDRMRLMPPFVDERWRLAHRLAYHWQTVNSYLLDFAMERRAPVIVVDRDLDLLVDRIAEAAGITLLNRAAVSEVLSQHHNRSTTSVVPPGADDREVERITAVTWELAHALAG